MLRRWGKEIAEGGSPPNILAMMERVDNGGGHSGTPSNVGASFSPMAEACDRLMHEIAPLDRELSQWLMAYSLGMSVTDMSRSFGVNRNKAAARLGEAMSALSMAVYYHRKK